MCLGLNTQIQGGFDPLWVPVLVRCVNTTAQPHRGFSKASPTNGFDDIKTVPLDLTILLHVSHQVHTLRKDDWNFDCDAVACDAGSD